MTEITNPLGTQADGPIPLGGPGSGHYGHAGRPGVRGGSLPGGLKRPADIDKEWWDSTPREMQKRYLDSERWWGSLTKLEKAAINHWGNSGRAFRKWQTGEMEDLDDRDKNLAEELADDWASAVDKGVPYEGTVYRGLSDVPKEVIDKWIADGGFQLNCDQSATRDLELSDHWTGNFRGSVKWIADQKSGVDLFERTRVTYGYKSKAEYEVVLRQGTKYRINSYRYVRENGKVFDSDWFFEGEDYSWPDNPPAGWDIERQFSGHYEFFIEEVQ